MQGVYINFSCQLSVVSCQFREPASSTTARLPFFRRLMLATKGGVSLAGGYGVAALQKSLIGGLIKNLPKR
jgi:hypothetical protein